MRSHFRRCPSNLQIPALGKTPTSGKEIKAVHFTSSKSDVYVKKAPRWEFFLNNLCVWQTIQLIFKDLRTASTLVTNNKEVTVTFSPWDRIHFDKWTFIILKITKHFYQTTVFYLKTHEITQIFHVSSFLDLGLQNYCATFSLILIIKSQTDNDI